LYFVTQIWSDAWGYDVAEARSGPHCDTPVCEDQRQAD